MNADKHCTANFELARTLTINKAGAGSGTVGGAGSYANGTTASAAATADTNSFFTGWSGDCGTGTTSPVDVLMDGNKTCTATFVRAWTLTVNSNGTGSGILGGAGIYVDSTTVLVSATANPDSFFTGWSGACGGDTSPVNVTMDADKTCTATFALMRTLTVNTSGAGSGTVGGAGSYVNGIIVSVSATANPDSIFTGWSGDCGGNTNPVNVTMDADKTCTATFALRRALTVNTSGAGSGTVGGAGSYADGAIVSVSATANPDSNFIGWGGDCTGTTSPVNVTMNTDKTCTAIFALTPTLTIILTGNGKGKVTSSPSGIDCGTDCTETYATNTSVTLTAIPVADYVFKGWSDSNCPGIAPCTVIMDTDKVISANFQKYFPWMMFLPTIINKQP